MNRYNPNSPEYHEAYKRATRRVQARLGFQRHLVSYLFGSVLLIMIYLLTTVMPGFPSYPWFIWPIIGWGVMIGFHFLEVFVFTDSRAEYKRRQMIDQEMQKLR